MTTLIERISQKAMTVRAAPPLVSPAREGQAWWSIDEDVPAKYADYLATSNDVHTVAWLRAKMFSKLPYTGTIRSGEAADDNHDALLLLRRPNRHWSEKKLKVYLELCMSIWGQAFLVMERGVKGQGRIRELWPVKPTMMRPVADRSDYLKGYLFFPPDGGKPIPYEPHEVVWFCYPSLTDDFGASSPLAAVRLAADVASASMKANRNLFEQGMLGGGFVAPPNQESSYTPEQAAELEALLDRRFRGVDRAHRWTVLHHSFQTQAMSVTPSDAEFIEGMNLSFRHVARGMGVPPALAGDGEFATLANLRVYERMFWEHTGEFEADFLASELTRQFVPAFPGLKEIGFDLSNVVALQEDENERWKREREQLQTGAIVINEWREEYDLEPVPWGDTPWLPANLIPVTSDEEDAEGGRRWRITRDAGEDSIYTEQQLRRLASVNRAQERPTEAMADDLRGLFKRQRDFLLQAVKQDSIDPDDPFDRDDWAERFVKQLGPRILTVMEDAYDEAFAEVGGEQRAVRARPNTRKAMLRAGRMAENLHDSTYRKLRDALRKAIEKGASTEEMAAAVSKVMDNAIRHRARTAAATEVAGATTDAQVAAWTDAKTEIQKEWVTALDEDVRDSHRHLHGTRVGVDEDFNVGACAGPGPATTGCPEEDINCRCVLNPVRVERGAEGSNDATLAELKEILG